MKLKHILILQNKIDLVKESQAKEQYEQILAFVQGECGAADCSSPAFAAVRISLHKTMKMQNSLHRRTPLRTEDQLGFLSFG